jgi:hypothetical protein
MGFLSKLFRRLRGRDRGQGAAQEKDGSEGLQGAIGNRLTTKALQQQLVPKAWPSGTTGPRTMLSNHHPDESDVGGDAVLDSVWGKKTHFARSDKEQSRYMMSTSRANDGRTLLTGNDGKLLDTSKSTMPVGMSRDEGRNIFVMGADGKMRSLDVGSEFHRINPNVSDDSNQWSDAERVHHSTMLAGNDVMAAGEMEVDQGQLRMMSNRSGHYRPPVAALHQAVSQLDRSGVEMGGVGLQLLGDRREGDRTGSPGMRSVPALQFLAHSKEMEAARQQAQDPTLNGDAKTRIMNQPLEAIRADRERNANWFAAAAALARRKGLGDPTNPSEETSGETAVGAQPADDSDPILYNQVDQGLAQQASVPASESFYNLEEQRTMPNSAAAADFYSLEEQQPAEETVQTAEEPSPAEVAAEVERLYRMSPL